MVASVPDDLEDEYDDVPNGESLIAAAVALAATAGEDGLADAQLVQRYWRFAPDEELVD